MQGWQPTPIDAACGAEESLGLSIAGITLGFVHGQDVEIVMPGSFSDFQTKNTADIRLEVRRVSVIPEASSQQLLFDSGGSWKLFREASGGLMFSCHAPAFGDAPYQVARVDRELTRGEVLLDERRFPQHHHVAGLEYPLGELLLEHLLCSRQGIELHASGVVTEDGRGYIFTAQSGGGKTTMSRIWQNARNVRILSDDRIVLRLSEGGVIMHGTPWHGEGAFSEAASVPVTALYFLRQTDRNEAFRMVSSLAVARLLSTSFVPFYDKALMGECLQTLTRVVECVPTFELGFVPDAHVVEFILNHAS